MIKQYCKHGKTRYQYRCTTGRAEFFSMSIINSSTFIYVPRFGLKLTQALCFEAVLNNRAINPEYYIVSLSLLPSYGRKGTDPVTAWYKVAPMLHKSTASVNCFWALLSMKAFSKMSGCCKVKNKRLYKDDILISKTKLPLEKKEIHIIHSDIYFCQCYDSKGTHQVFFRSIHRHECLFVQFKFLGRSKI